MNLKQLRKEQPEFPRCVIEKAEKFTQDLETRIVLYPPQDELANTCVELHAYTSGVFDTTHISVGFYGDGAVYLDFSACASQVAAAKTANSKKEVSWVDLVERQANGREVPQKQYQWIPQNIVDNVSYFLYCIKWKIGAEPDGSVLLCAAPNTREGVVDYFLKFRITREGIEAMLGANRG